MCSLLRRQLFAPSIKNLLWASFATVFIFSPLSVTQETKAKAEYVREHNSDACGGG